MKYVPQSEFRLRMEKMYSQEFRYIAICESDMRNSIPRI